MAQTRTYADFLTAFQGLAGETLTATELTRVKQLVNMRAKTAYNQCVYWPSFIRTNEPRRVRRSIFDFTSFGETSNAVSGDDTYSNDYTYSPGNKELNLLRRGWAADGAGDPTNTLVSNDPFESSNQDYILTEDLWADRARPLDTIDTVFRIFAGDPFRSKSVHELNWSQERDRIMILGEGNKYASDLTLPCLVTDVSGFGAGAFTVDFLAGETPHFRIGDHIYINSDLLTETTSTGITLSGPYKVAVASLSGSTWSAIVSGIEGSYNSSTLDYNPDNGLAQVVKLPTVYVTYRAKLPDNYGDGVGETSAIPREFFNYLVRGVYCDFLRSEGQTERAQAEDANAQDELSLELERVEKQQNHPLLLTRFQSHGVEQNRIY